MPDRQADKTYKPFIFEVAIRCTKLGAPRRNSVEGFDLVQLDTQPGRSVSGPKVSVVIGFVGALHVCTWWIHLFGRINRLSNADRICRAHVQDFSLTSAKLWPEQPPYRGLLTFLGVEVDPARFSVPRGELHVPGQYEVIVIEGR